MINFTIFPTLSRKTTVIEALRKINLEFKIGEFVAITGKVVAKVHLNGM